MGDRDVIVVVQKGDHSLGYYDFETGAEIDRVAVDPFPHECALSPDRRLAYLANFGVALAAHGGPGGNTVSVVDQANFTVLNVTAAVGTLSDQVAKLATAGTALAGGVW